MEQGFAASELWSVMWHGVATVLHVGNDRAALEGDTPGADHPAAEPDWNLLSPQGRSCRMAGHLPWTLLHILPSLAHACPRQHLVPQARGLGGLFLRIAVVLWGQRAGLAHAAPSRQQPS